jgi:hypothetical protein
MRQTLHSGRQVLRRRAFRRFWLGMMISRAGDAFTLADLYGIAAVSALLSAVTEVAESAWPPSPGGPTTSSWRVAR